MTRRRGSVVVVGVILGMYLTAGASTHVGEMAAYDRAQVTNEFWQGVAGEVVPQGIEPQDNLARALNSQLGNIDEPTDFIARPNAYSGAREALGFEPFDTQGLGCSECGPLSDTLFDGVQAIQETGWSEPVLDDAPEPNFALTNTSVGAELLGLLLGLVGWVIGTDLRHVLKTKNNREHRLKDKNLWEVYVRLGDEIQDLRNLDEEQRRSQTVLDRVAELQTMRNAIALAADTENAAHEEQQISDAVGYHIRASDELLQQAKDALQARQDALRTLEG